MRILLFPVFLLTLLAASFVSPPAAQAVDCGAIRSACIADCSSIVGNPARLRACTTRCSLAVCPTASPLCRPGDQTICRNGFSSCNGACNALAAIPSAAATANASACALRCCSDFRACLSARSCDVSGIVCSTR
jgi:hypothetical protein